MREFDNKVAFVTGAASGIGLSLARAFGRANMRVMLADIETDALNSAVAELQGSGIDARGVRMRRNRLRFYATGCSGNLSCVWEATSPLQQCRCCCRWPNGSDHFG